MTDSNLGVWTYKYDQNGNLIFQSGGGGNLVTGDGYYRKYNDFGQLIKVRNGSSAASPLLEEYWYDPNGQRIKIVRNDSANTKVYTPFRELMRIVNSSGSYDFTYVYQEGQLVARINPDGTKQYEHTDHLGSTSVITNSSGGIIENTSYSPYGEELSGGNLEVKGYTGQFDDEATGQMYYGARYYGPDDGLFVQGDPLFTNKASYKEVPLKIYYSPQNINPYSYVINNPYRYTDPTGLWTLQIGGSGSAGFLSGGSYGGGLIIGYSGAGGFQYGTYRAYGGGLHAGATGSLTLDVSGSTNDYIEDIGGNTLTIGGSADVGASVGGELNLPIEDKKDNKKQKNVIHPSGTVNIGIGTPTGGEGHVYSVTTIVNQRGGRNRAGQSEALQRFWDKKKEENKKKGENK